MLSKNAEAEVRRLVNDLVQKRFSAIVQDGRNGRLTEEEIRFAIERYGRSLVPLPENEPLAAEVYEAPEGLLQVDITLWTAEEGQSDLTLSVTVTGNPPKVGITDLHVL